MIGAQIKARFPSCQLIMLTYLLDQLNICFPIIGIGLMGDKYHSFQKFIKLFIFVTQHYNSLPK